MTGPLPATAGPPRNTGNRLSERPGQTSWIVAVVTCHFNVDVGPTVDSVYPPSTSFSVEDLGLISFSSFPERHDRQPSVRQMFQFTIENRSPALAVDSAVLHGNTVFHTTFDRTVRRSCHQRSLTIVTTHSYPALFAAMLDILVRPASWPDSRTIEMAVAQIAAWSAPEPGQHLLPFVGARLTVEIAPHPCFPLQGLIPSVRPDNGGVGRAGDGIVCAYEPPARWASVLSVLSTGDIYAAVERLLLDRPVIVVSQSPEQCSQAVWLLLDLVKPVTFSGLCRPYMTVQTFFSRLGCASQLPKSFIIGTTNPLLVQAVDRLSASLGRRPPLVLYMAPTAQPAGQSGPARPKRRSRSSHDALLDIGSWAKILQPDPGEARAQFLKPDRRLGRRVESVTRATASTATAAAAAAAAVAAAVAGRADEDLARIEDHDTDGSTPPEPGVGRRMRSESCPSGIDPPNSPVTPLGCFRPSMMAGPVRLSNSASSSAVDVLVRRHFAQLTAQFLSPINRYLTTISTIATIPCATTSTVSSSADSSPASIAGLSATPTYLPFAASAFLAHLAKHGSALLFRGSTDGARRTARDEMYGRFIRSANFAVWLHSKVQLEREAWAGVL